MLTRKLHSALALKHTHRMFYNIVDTSVRLKVAWLLDRKVRGLPTPEKMCCLKSDSEFCNGGLVGGWEKGRRRGKVQDGAGQVSSIMARRRRHGECDRGVCEVLVGRRCGGRKEVDGLRVELFGLRSWVGGFPSEWWRVTRFRSLAVDCGLWVLVGLVALVLAFTFELL